MPKMLSPNTTIWWVPADAITSTADLFKATTYTALRIATRMTRVLFVILVTRRPRPLPTMRLR